MTRKEWEKIKEAADLLSLGETASLAEIKKAYRHKSKKHHPDVRKHSKQKAEKIEMHKLTEAYQILLHYCSEYRFPLVPGDNEIDSVMTIIGVMGVCRKKMAKNNILKQ